MKLQNYLINEANEATQSMIDEIAQLTSDNDHFEARVQLAGMMGDIELQDIYKTLRILHEKYKVGNIAVMARDKVEPTLYKKILKKWKNGKDMKMAL